GGHTYRHPARSMPEGSPEGVCGRSANQQRRSRRTRAEVERLAVRLDDVTREAAVEERQRVVGDAPAPTVVDPDGAELGRHPADADSEAKPLAGELLDGPDPLRGGERGPAREHEDRGAQPD